MRYLALCCDYDGTLATRGELLPDTIAALERLIASGRRLVMVTGRELDDLQSRLPAPRPVRVRRRRERRPALPPGHPRPRRRSPSRRRSASSPSCARRGVSPMSVGRVIVATWEPHETVVLETIRDLGLELQVIFNKGAVMVLPAGVNKATGLAAALERDGPVAAQRRRRRRRRERPRLPALLRVLRGRRQRPADAQGARRHRDRAPITAPASRS